MQETSEETINENVAEEQSSQKSKRGIIAGLLVATGTLLAVGAKFWHKVDLSKLQQRLRNGRLLPLNVNEDASQSGDHEEPGPETTAPPEQPVDASEEPEA